MKSISDQLETLIIMALDANHDVNEEARFSNGPLESVRDQGCLLGTEPMHPLSAFAVGLEKNRLYSGEPNELLAHPSEIIGDESEIIILNENPLFVKWYGLRKLRKAPKGVAWLGKPVCWYELHKRFISSKGQGEYLKRVVPLDKNGFALLCKVQGHNICLHKHEGVDLILCASVIEDAYRSNTLLASVKDATEIKFPVPLADYKSVFANREAPLTDSNRRKAILHWVAEHLRNSPKGTPHLVKTHLRGVDEFFIDGLRIRLETH